MPMVMEKYTTYGLMLTILFKTDYSFQKQREVPMDPNLMSDYSTGIFVIFGIIFLVILVGFLIRWLVISTKKEMCTMDRNETRRIARDEAQGEMNTRMRQLDIKERDIKKARQLLRDERDLEKA
jgi:hypothetical protein